MSEAVPLGGAAGLDEARLRRFLDHFYAKVRRDEMIGPLFERVIGPEWGPHLDRIQDFWSSVMLKTGRYNGNPLAVHRRIEGLEPAFFDRWLALFEESAREMLTPELAETFRAKAHLIADSLRLGLYFAPARKPAA
jgi:hemoglobin